ncbi:MAG: hypothetical protein RMY29_026785 [Nostoc sp. CreGUA01]|nr:hypothetical protein [Nostoc sp. CreGUA01]
MIQTIIHNWQKFYIVIFTFLLVNIFILNKVEAKIKIILESQNNTKVISKNPPDKNIIKNLRTRLIAQQLTPVPVRILPTPNGTKIPEILNPLNPFQKPDANFDEFYPEQPDTLPEQKNPVLKKKELEIFILNALTNSASRYPWIIDPRDNLSFYSRSFNPFKNTNYTDISIKLSGEDSILDRFTFAHFPKEDQFYWVLSGNRIVIETQGWQSGILYQGESSDFERRQIVRLTQRFWGMQAVLALPENFQELVRGIGANQFSIQSIAAELNNPQGISAPPLLINSTRGGSSDTTAVSSIIPNLTTINPDNPPLILQSFPTNNLQPLLGSVGLDKGTVIPRDILEQAGFVWGNPLTGERTRVQLQTTSIPGIKVGNRDQFDNSNLYDILLDPSITDSQRDLYYLNSLFWFPLGQRQNLLRTTDKRENYNWQRFYVNRPHNRTLLQYDSLVNKVTYTNIYSNPGFSLPFSFNQIAVDEIQTANTTLGMLMGGIFELIDIPQLEQSLREAKERFSRQENFAPFNSKATSEQRRNINQVLNRTLFLANLNSSLEQVSGRLNFPSTITPNSSSIVQIRTGNHRRAVQFIDGKQTWGEGETFISKTDISNNSFGGLRSVNLPIPSAQTSILPNNRSSALQVILTSPDEKLFVQNVNSSDSTTVPMNIRSFDMAFDRIELSQNGRLSTYLQSFTGYLYLPTIETLWAGSSGNWNYGVNSGLWFNLNADTAFGITNNLGISEPTLGVYTNGLLNYISTSLGRNADGKPQATTSHIPALRFHWNSSANYQNPNYLNLSYSFFHQDQNRNNYSLATGVIFFDESRNLTQAGFFQGALQLSTGLEFKTNVEISEDFYYSLEGTQKINSNWYLGAYIQNFRNTNRGIISRVNDFSYGLLIKRDIPGNATFWESRLGMSGDNLEVLFEGGFRF